MTAFKEKTLEVTQVRMNSASKSPSCSGFHGQLGHQPAEQSGSMPNPCMFLTAVSLHLWLTVGSLGHCLSTHSVGIWPVKTQKCIWLLLIVADLAPGISQCCGCTGEGSESEKGVVCRLWCRMWLGEHRQELCFLHSGNVVSLSVGSRHFGKQGGPFSRFTKRDLLYRICLSLWTAFLHS